jgi:hypothetical protein
MQCCGSGAMENWILAVLADRGEVMLESKSTKGSRAWLFSIYTFYVPNP